MPLLICEFILSVGQIHLRNLADLWCKFLHLLPVLLGLGSSAHLPSYLPYRLDVQSFLEHLRHLIYQLRHIGEVLDDGVVFHADRTFCNDPQVHHITPRQNSHQQYHEHQIARRYARRPANPLKP